ncbi:MAG TPA: hypothetical protein VGE40_05730 [Bacilli bacterium]
MENVANNEESQGIKRYCQKHGMWIVLHFSQEQSQELQDEIIDILAREYMNTVLLAIEKMKLTL